MTSPGLLLGMLLASGSLSAPLDPDVPYTPPARLPSPPNYEKRDPKIVREQVAKVAKLVTALDAKAELNEKAIAEVTGVALGAPKQQPVGGVEYEVTLPSGPFGRMALRHSKPEAASRWWILSLEVRRGVALRKSDFPRELIGDRVRYDGNGGREGSFTYILERPDKRTLFGFNLRTGAFQGTWFHRGAAAKTP